MIVSIIKRFGGKRPGQGVKLSLNDPRWGHKPGDERKAQEGKRPGNNNSDGPPDLDQLWRDFNQRLNRLFGKRGGGGDPYRPDARGVGITATVVGAIAVLIWLASGAFIVQEGQVGLVSTFGRFSHTTGAGFNWRWPAPFQSVEFVNTAQVQTAEIGYRGNIRDKQPAESLMLTGDENIVDIQYAVQYKIKDPVAWAFNNRDQVETVRDAAETTVRELVGKSKMDALLVDGRERVGQDARRQLQQMADRYGLGAEIVAVTLQQVAAPDQVAAAFEDATKAAEDGKRMRSEAQAYADDILPQAKGKVQAMLQDAEAYRARVENQAEGAAARFDKVVAEYAKAPAVTRDRIYIDTMQDILSRTSKIMIDARTGTNNITLPLDRMLAQSVANEAAVGSRSGPMMAPPNMQPSQQQQGAQPAPQAPGQAQPPQAQAVPQQQDAAPASAPAPAPAAQAQQASARQHDPRSREHSRERETR